MRPSHGNPDSAPGRTLGHAPSFVRKPSRIPKHTLCSAGAAALRAVLLRTVLRVRCCTRDLAASAVLLRAALPRTVLLRAALRAADVWTPAGHMQYGAGSNSPTSTELGIYQFRKGDFFSIGEVVLRSSKRTSR